MVTTLENYEGYVYAIMEWQVVDELGVRNKAGHYMYVTWLWIHPNYKGKRTLNSLIKIADGHDKMKNVVGVYWENLKRGDRLTPMYDRDRLAKEAKKGSLCLSN